jgi:hypothetical protein
VNNKRTSDELIPVIYCSERSGDAFTAGLYLFVYASLLENRLTSADAASIISFAGIDAAPSAWAVGLLLPITFLIACLEIPTGYVADWRGPRFAVVTSWVFRSGFFASWWLAFRFVESAHTLIAVTYLSTIPFAIAYTLRSGANQAWLHYGLAETGLRGGELNVRRNAINDTSVSIYWTVTLFGSLAAVYASKYRPDLVFLCGGGLSVVFAVILFVTMNDYRSPKADASEYTEESDEDRALFLASFETWHISIRWLVLLVVAGIAGGFMVLADLVDHTWLMVCNAFTDRSEAFHAMWLVAAMGGAAIVGSILARSSDAYFCSRSARNEVLLFSIVATAFGLAHVGVFAFPVFLGLFIFLLLKELVRGAFDGPKENLVQGLIPEDHKYRAVIISCVSLVGNLMVAGAAVYFFAAKQAKASSLVMFWACAGVALAACSFLLIVATSKPFLILAQKRGDHTEYGVTEVADV